MLQESIGQATALSVPEAIILIDKPGDANMSTCPAKP